MGIVLDFHDAATSARAAKAARVSRVKPASRARSVRQIANHHSGGMDDRCGHLRAATGLAPISAASKSGDGHKRTTSRKEEQIMQTILGQPVPENKALLWSDEFLSVGHNVSMDKDEKQEKIEDALFRKAFRQRLREAQKPRKNAVMAKLLGITESRYSKYVGRGSKLPLRFLPEIADICGVSERWLLTGKQEDQLRPRKERETPQPKSTRQRRQA